MFVRRIQMGKARKPQTGEVADYRIDKRHGIVIEARRVTGADGMTLRLLPGGGQAIRLIFSR